MPTPVDPNHQPDDLCLPDELVDRLSAMHDARLFVPPDTDRAVLARARARFGVRPEDRRRRWLRFAAPAAAASIALGVWAVWPFPTSPGGGPPIVIAGDVDHSGSVDILDAFTMARLIDTGQPSPADWDVTGDGRVDRADVSAVAAIAVSLSGGTGGDGDTGGHGGIGGSSS